MTHVTCCSLTRALPQHQHPNSAFLPRTTTTMRPLSLCGLLLVVAVAAMAPSAAAWVVKAPARPAAFVVPATKPSLGARIARQPGLSRARSVQRWAAGEEGEGEGKGKLPFLLDVNTRGGVLFVPTVGTLAVFAGYKLAVDQGIDGLQAGIYISVGMTVAMVAWTVSYIFRVANKDMTYAKQLKNYEDAVLAKRLEELEADEVEALLEEVEKEGVKP